MNKSIKQLSAVLAIGSLLLLSGCASYKAMPLPRLEQRINKNGVSFAYKAFNAYESKRYLGRNILEKGYQPVQITVTNNTDRSYRVDPSSLSMPIANAELVAQLAHTNTTGRAVGYGTAAVLSCGLFAIPAIVDGIGSSKANKQLDIDYSSKVLNLNTVIRPHTTLSGVVFVESKSYNEDFSFTLTDTKSGEELELNSTTIETK